MATTESSLLKAQRVAILGLGLMGGSLALALWGQCRALLGIDADPQVVELARQQKVVDLVSNVPARLLPQADVIILAAPVNAILQILQDLPSLHPGPAIVMDLGSTKVRVVEAMKKLPSRFDPIGGHPMCGKESSSLANADALLYQGAPFAFTPLERTTESARLIVQELATRVGAHPLWLDAEVHDRWVAATSHLPYLLSNALAYTTPPDASPLAGPGYRSTSRLALTSPYMMLDVLLTNRENVLAASRHFRAHLDLLGEMLTRNDEAALLDLLRQGANRQEEILAAIG